MDRAKVISGYLPNLRRYARAIMGTQKGGDAAVLAALQALVNRRTSALEDRAVRIELYKVLLEICTGPAGGHILQLASDCPQSSAEQAVSCLSMRPRQAFLLTAMEGFSHNDTAEILGCSVPEAQDLLSRAQIEIATQTSTEVLIIEDEVFIAQELARLVERLGHRVYAKVRTHKQAIRAIDQHHKPGLILADICLADGSNGIDAVNQILRSLTIPVIFITAYPERLLTGQPPEPTFLISKPFTERELRGVISQVLFFKAAAYVKSGRSTSGAQAEIINGRTITGAA